MADPIHLPLDDDDRLADPPLVDSLHYERDADGFSITFVPSISEEPTRFVFIPRDSPEGRQVAAYLYRVQQLIGSHLEKVVHRGGGDYTFRIAGGATWSLSDQAANKTWVPEVFDRLKQTAQVAEAAFNILRAGRT